jgi:hypothetical protein
MNKKERKKERKKEGLWWWCLCGCSLKPIETTRNLSADMVK